MSFHTSVKSLQPKDMTLEEGVVKGAVILDEKMTDWNPAVGSLVASSHFTTINKNTEYIEDIVRRTADALKLPETEAFALLDETRLFVSQETLHLVQHGFLLTMTCAPQYYAAKLKSHLYQVGDVLEISLLNLSLLTVDPIFVRAFYEISSILQLYELLETETVKGNPRLLHLLLLSISNALETGVNGINWTTVPAGVIRSLAVQIIGQAKCEDSNTVLIVLQMMEKLVTCESEEAKEIVLSEVPARSLIRHLEKSDLSVNKGAISLLNSFHNNSNERIQAEVIELLDTVPFRSAIRGSVLRDCRVRDGSLMEQLVPLERLLLNRETEAIEMGPTEEQIRILTNLPILLECGVSPSAVESALAESELGQFGATVLARYLTEHAEDVRILVSENSMRINGGCWVLAPMCLNCLTILAELLSILPTENDSVEQLLEFLFMVNNPIGSLFSVIVQLYHRTWREMQANSDESDKVGKVVRQQIRRAVEKFTATVAGLEEAFAAFPYWKMQEIWHSEEIERENSQLSSKAVSNLKTQLQPSIEGMVRLNRRNFIKRGFTFRKVHKAKSSKELFCFWRLDASEKYVVMTETDVDSYVEGVSHVGKVRKVLIKDITSVQLGDDGATIRKGGPVLRALRLSLTDHEIVSVGSSSDHALYTWLDGLNELIGQKTLSPDANEKIDRLLNIELRLRLTVVPQPLESITVPPLPTDFHWITQAASE